MSAEVPQKESTLSMITSSPSLPCSRAIKQGPVRGFVRALARSVFTQLDKFHLELPRALTCHSENWRTRRPSGGREGTQDCRTSMHVLCGALIKLVLATPARSVRADKRAQKSFNLGPCSENRFLPLAYQLLRHKSITGGKRTVGKIKSILITWDRRMRNWENTKHCSATLTLLYFPCPPPTFFSQPDLSFDLKKNGGFFFMWRF